MDPNEAQALEWIEAGDHGRLGGYEPEVGRLIVAGLVLRGPRWLLLSDRARELLAPGTGVLRA